MWCIFTIELSLFSTCILHSKDSVYNTQWTKIIHVIICVKCESIAAIACIHCFYLISLIDNLNIFEVLLLLLWLFNHQTKTMNPVNFRISHGIFHSLNLWALGIRIGRAQPTFGSPENNKFKMVSPWKKMSEKKSLAQTPAHVAIKCFYQLEREKLNGFKKQQFPLMWNPAPIQWCLETLDKWIMKWKSKQKVLKPWKMHLWPLEKTQVNWIYVDWPCSLGFVFLFIIVLLSWSLDLFIFTCLQKIDSMSV